MMQLLLEGEKPLLPEGYRWLLNGESVQEGDMFADTEFESWEPAQSWKRGHVTLSNCTYIRKLEPKDIVPFAQQSPAAT